MALDLYSEGYSIRSSWRARREEPEGVAARYKRFLDSLGDINDTLRPWMIGGRRPVPYQSVRDDMTRFVRRRVKRREDRTVDIREGYNLGGLCGDPRQKYWLYGHAGSDYDQRGANEIFITMDREGGVDTTIVTYDVLKAMVLSVIACWEPTSCSASWSKFDEERHEPDGRYWMIYVPPAHVSGADLVGVPFSERTLTGGLLLSATNDTYDMHSAAHAEGTRLIEAATRDLPERP